MSEPRKDERAETCPCGCGTPMVNGKPFADHPHVDPGDGRRECRKCGKWVHLVLHSCRGVPVTGPALARFHAARERRSTPEEEG